MKVKVSAGVFSSWLRRCRYMLLADTGMDVPCGDCRACCTSSKFVTVRPDEKVTLSRIPEKYLFRAPLQPGGNLVMGYDENGHCPMFRENRCTIYHDRPAACRNFDCRVFSAAGVQPDGKDAAICRQVNLWKFEYPCDSDRYLHKCVGDAARFIKDKPHRFPGGRVPEDTVQIAISSIKACTVFITEQNGPAIGQTDKAAAVRIVQAVREFDGMSSLLRQKKTAASGNVVYGLPHDP